MTPEYWGKPNMDRNLFNDDVKKDEEDVEERESQKDFDDDFQDEDD